MRRPGPRSLRDPDAVDVLLVEDEDVDVAMDVAADEVRRVLHELAVEATAWRSTWPGEPERLDPATADPAAAAGAGPVHPVRRLARRYRRRAVTGAVLALAVAVTTGVVDARRTAARAAALAADPAVLAAASQPPAPVWRRPGRIAGDGHAGLLVVDGGVLRAVDPETGDVLWTASPAAGRAASTGGCIAVDGVRGTGPEADPATDGVPAEDGAGSRDLLACGAGAGTGAGVGPDGVARAGAPGGTIPVVVVDAATGRTERTLGTDAAVLLAEPVGGDLLVAAALADGRVRVTRWDLGTGAPRWQTVSARPVPTAGTADAVTRRPRSVTVAGLAVDLATGRWIGADASDATYPDEEHTLPAGTRATWSWLGDGTSGRGRVWGDGASSYTLTGPPLRPPLTDGSDAGTLVVRAARGDRLRGMDLRTGGMRWSAPHPGASGLRATALVGGVMLLDDGAAVTALDVRTGTVVWRARVDAAATGGAALTDGQVALLPVRADDGALHLVAVGLADGTPAWRSTTPPGTVALTVVDHHLVALTGTEVVGLG